MAGIVSSAIVGEAVSLVFSGIATTTRKDEDTSDQETTEGGLERLEMARIKMEAALETSGKWHITDVSLLHWRKKLKRAAQDCDDIARKCRRLSQEEDEREQLVSQSSFPRRVAHATKAFVSSLFGCSNDNDHCSAGGSIVASVRRFERLANGAGEFMRFVELGGTRHRPHLFFDPLVGHIFAGELLLYRVSHPGGQRRSFGIRPMDFKDRGLEVMLSFMYEDHKRLENNFRLMFMLRLSESTDIIGTIVKCLRLVTPHFKSTADDAIKEITQLPTQDFSRVSSEVMYAQKEKWNPGITLTGWFRPDPLCCQGYEHRNSPSYGIGNGVNNSNGRSRNKLRLSNIFPEPVSQVFLQRHISLSEYNNLGHVSSTATTSSYNDVSASLENSPPLKLGILILPHDSLEVDPKSAGESGSTIEAINGEKQQHLSHVDVHPDQLDEMLMPKAIDYLYHNDEATTYQICWRSNHGSAHICVEKKSILVGVRRSTRHHRNIGKVFSQMQQDQEIRKRQCREIARDFLKLWVVRCSERLRSSILAWLKQ